MPALGQVSVLSPCLVFIILEIYALSSWDGKVFQVSVLLKIFVSARGCNPGSCLELQATRKGNQGIKSHCHSSEETTFFFLILSSQRIPGNYLTGWMIMGLGKSVNKFSSVDCWGTPKEVWEEYGLIFGLFTWNFPRPDQPVLERQRRIESKLKLATYQKRYFGLQMSSLQHGVAVWFINYLQNYHSPHDPLVKDALELGRDVPHRRVVVLGDGCDICILGHFQTLLEMGLDPCDVIVKMAMPWGVGWARSLI